MSTHYVKTAEVPKDVINDTALLRTSGADAEIALEHLNKLLSDDYSGGSDEDKDN